MSEYLILAESVIYKNDKLTCINVYNNFRTVALPAEFNFDMVILCGPKWTVGEHVLSIKVIASNGKEIDLGAATVNIPNENFVYTAFLNNIRLAMDYSVSDLNFCVYDDGREIYSRKYPVLPMLVPQGGVNPGVNGGVNPGANPEVNTTEANSEVTQGENTEAPVTA